MAWTFGIGEIEVWWERWSWKADYERSWAHHRLYLPSGVVVDWPRRSQAYKHVQRVRRWDAVETFVVRCAVAVGVGVAFGLLLVWLKGQL